MSNVRKLEDDLNIIQKLDDEPNDVGGLTSAQLKAKFDEAGLVIQKYINESLIPDLLSGTYQREVLVARYGITDAAEVRAAYEAGAAVFCVTDDGLIHSMCSYDGVTFRFGSVNDGVERVVECRSVWPAGSNWAYGTLEAAVRRNELEGENLLDNWYWLDPVNQRGQASYSAAGYGIDRWRAQYSATLVELTEGGVRLTNQRTSGNTFFRQVFERALEAGVYTMSAWVTEASGGTCTMYLYDEAGATISGSLKLESGKNKVTVTVPEGSKAVRIQITVPLESSVTVAMLGLQRGEGWSTPANPPDKAAQLNRCKWFFERVRAADAALTLGVGCGSATTLHCPLKLAPKRTAPDTQALADCAAHLRYGTAALTSTPTQVALEAFDPETGFAALTLTGTFTAGGACCVGLAAGGYVDFDCEV